MGKMMNQRPLQTVLDEISTGAFSVGENCSITAWNKKALEITGLTPEDMAGQKCLWYSDGKCLLNLYCNLEKQYNHKDMAVVNYESPSGVTKKLKVQAINPTGFTDDTTSCIMCFEEVMMPLNLDETQYNNIGTWEAILTASPDGIAVISLDGRLRFVSDRLINMFGYELKDRDAFIGRWIIDFVAPEDRERLTENLWKMLSGDDIDDINEYKAIKMNGDDFYIEVTSSTLKNLTGDPINLLITARDVTQYRKMTRELALSELKYTTIFDSSPIAIAVIEADGTFSHVNHALLELFHIDTANELDGALDIDQLLLIGDRHEVLKQYGLVKFSAFVTVKESTKNLDISIKRMTFDGDESFYVLQAVDMTQQHAAIKQLEFISAHDALTGLYNRRQYQEELKRLDHSQYFPLSVIMADVNGLKLINDTFGHTYGDELLEKSASIFKDMCRANDIIARIGGDEFVILLANTSGSDAMKIIDQITEQASKTYIRSIPISISFGIATKDKEDINLDGLVIRSEKEMYKNKHTHSAQFKRDIVEGLRHRVYETSHEMSDFLAKLQKAIKITVSSLGWEDSDINRLNALYRYAEIGLGTFDSMNDQLPASTVITSKLLSQVPSLSFLADHVNDINENFDGSGNPKGISGNEISKYARLYRIIKDYLYHQYVDGEDFDKKAYMQQAGSKYDPVMAETFIEIYENQPWEN